MKKIVVSTTIMLFACFFGLFVYHKVTSEKTNYDFTTFKRIPNVVQNNKKTIIFVAQDNCSYCKLVEPIINDYAGKNKGVVHSVVWNKDSVSQTEKYHIQGTPTLIFYKDGKEVHRITKGFTDKEFHKIIEKVDF